MSPFSDTRGSQQFMQTLTIGGSIANPYTKSSVQRKGAFSIRSNKKSEPTSSDLLLWTRRDLHPLPHVSMVRFYCINYGPGSTASILSKYESVNNCFSDKFMLENKKSPFLRDSFCSTRSLSVIYGHISVDSSIANLHAKSSQL